MYRIVIDEIPTKHNQLTFDQTKELLISGKLNAGAIRVERYDTVLLAWIHVPLAKFYEKAAAV